MSEYLDRPLSDEELSEINKHAISFRDHIILENLKMRINRSYEIYTISKSKEDEEGDLEIGLPEVFAVSSIGAFGIGAAPLAFCACLGGLAIYAEAACNSAEISIEASNIARSLVTSAGNMYLNCLDMVKPLIDFSGSLMLVGVSLKAKEYMVNLIKKKVKENAEKNKRPIKEENIDSIINGLVSIQDVRKTIDDLRIPIQEDQKEDDGIIFVKEFFRSVDISKISEYINPILYKLVEIRNASLEVDKLKRRRPKTLQRAQENLENKKVELANMMFKINYEKGTRDYIINQDFVGNLIKKADITFTDTYSGKVIFRSTRGNVYVNTDFIGQNNSNWKRVGDIENEDDDIVASESKERGSGEWASGYKTR